MFLFYPVLLRVLGLTFSILGTTWAASVVLPRTARCRSRASSPKSTGDAAAPCVVCETSHFLMEFQDTLRRISLKLGTFGAFGPFELEFYLHGHGFHLHGHGIPRAGDGGLRP